MWTRDDSPFGRGPIHVGHPQPSRRIVTGRCDCVTGYHPSAKSAMNYRMVAFEGDLAGDYLLILDLDTDVISYREEPDPFKWFDPISDRMAKYTADFSVNYRDIRTLCVEVRPKNRLRELNDERVLEQRKAAAKKAGYADYQLVTEEQIDPVRLANAKAVARGRSLSVEDDFVRSMRRTISSFVAPFTIGEARRQSNLKNQSYQAILQLIGQGELMPVSYDVPLDDRAIIALPCSMR